VGPLQDLRGQAEKGGGRRQVSDGISDIEKSNRLEVEDWALAETMGQEVWDAVRDAERAAGMGSTYSRTQLHSAARFMDTWFLDEGPTGRVEDVSLVHSWACAFAVARGEGLK